MQREIQYGDKNLLVGFSYKPPEPPVMYYSDGSGYPGALAKIDIISVYDELGRDIAKELNWQEYRDIIDIIAEKYDPDDN